jgi:hypothetical protein
MNVRAVIVAGALPATFAIAQVTVSEQTSRDKTTTHAELTLTTRDRSVVPFVMESKQIRVDPTTTRNETVRQVRHADGTYTTLQRTSSVTRKTGANTSETSTETIEVDRQGRPRTTGRATETVTTLSGSGEQSRAVEYRRDSSGNFVLAGETTVRSAKNSDGSVLNTRVEKQADVNGRLTVKRQVDETVASRGANEKTITRTVRSVGLDGRFAVTEEQAETITAQGNTTRTETVIRKPGRGGLGLAGKVTTIETRGADGATQRETIEQGRSVHSIYAGDRDQPLVAQTKVVERETRQPDGSVRLQRDVFRRDVNGDWKPVTFSTEAAN